MGGLVMYYWDLYFADGGEVMQYGAEFPSIKAAVKHAKNFINHTLDYYTKGTEVNIKISDIPQEVRAAGDVMIEDFIYEETYFKRTGR